MSNHKIWGYLKKLDFFDFLLNNYDQPTRKTVFLGEFTQKYAVFQEIIIFVKK
jgi:hypothetical protein